MSHRPSIATEPSTSSAMCARSRQGLAAVLFVLLTDGRAIEIGARFPEPLKAEAHARLETLRTMDPARVARGGGLRAWRSVPLRGSEAARRTGAGGSPGSIPTSQRRASHCRPSRTLPPSTGSAPFPPGARGRRAGDPRFAPGRGAPPGFRTGRPWPIVADGRVVGLVVVPPQPPFTFLLTRYAPSWLIVASDLDCRRRPRGGRDLRAGAPAPQRVEDAARRLGAGDLSARAPPRQRRNRGSRRRVQCHGRDLSARAEALAAAPTARRQLLADVSHELNTPVTAMRGYLETLAHAGAALDEATRARYLAIVGDETSRLERIIGDLLDLARLEGGGGTLRRRDVPVEAAVRAGRRASRTGLPAGAGVTMRCRSTLAQTRDRAIAIVSSRRCRTLPPTRCATRRRDRRSAWRCAPAIGGVDAGGRAMKGPGIAARASAAHFRSLLQGGRVAAGLRAAAAWACRSSRRSSSGMADRSR